MASALTALIQAQLAYFDEFKGTTYVEHQALFGYQKQRTRLGMLQGKDRIDSVFRNSSQADGDMCMLLNP